MKNIKRYKNSFTTPFHIGTVVKNDDPEKAYRIKVRVDIIHNNIPDEQLPWAARVGPTFLGFGNADISHAVPEVGTKVLVLFVADDPNSILYIGSLYSKSSIAPSGSEYTDNYGIYTKKGEFIGVEKINNVFHMIWNGDLTLDVEGQIKIGSNASEPAVLGTKLESLLTQIISTFNMHTHTGNLGVPTSPPTQPITQTSVTSQKVVVE